MCLFAGIQFVLVGASRVKDSVYLAFGCLCLLLAGDLLLTAALFQAQSIATASMVVRAQIAFSCCIYPAAIGFIGLYSGLAHWRRWFAVAAAAFGAFFIINLFSPGSALYSSISATAPLLLPWGERVSHFDGVESYFAPAYYVVVGLCFVWALACCIALWWRGRYQRMWPLVLYLAIQFVASEHAQWVYRSGERAVTFEVLAFLALALIMSDVLRRQLRGQTKALGASLISLRIETDRRQSVEEDLRRLAYHDRLTALPNRHRLHDDLQAALDAQATDHGALAPDRSRPLQGRQRCAWSCSRR
ncbi:MAG: GGDEF domain-containing protein [Dokdonella sp.]